MIELVNYVREREFPN